MFGGTCMSTFYSVLYINLTSLGYELRSRYVGVYPSIPLRRRLD
jgi:hypothetical protein